MILVRKYGAHYKIKKVSSNNEKVRRIKEDELPKNILIAILKINMREPSAESETVGRKIGENVWLLKEAE